VANINKALQELYNCLNCKFQNKRGGMYILIIFTGIANLQLRDSGQKQPFLCQSNTERKSNQVTLPFAINRLVKFLFLSNAHLAPGYAPQRPK
jgi:hypothetical protein